MSGNWPIFTLNSNFSSTINAPLCGYTQVHVSSLHLALRQCEVTDWALHLWVIKWITALFNFISFPIAQQPSVGKGLLIIEASHSHADHDLYFTIRNTYKRQTSMLPVGFEPTIPASERPQTHDLDRTNTGIGC